MSVCVEISKEFVRRIARCLIKLRAVRFVRRILRCLIELRFVRSLLEELQCVL